MRGKPLGFPLQFAEIRSRQLGENFASKIFPRASKTALLAATHEAGFSQYPAGIARFRLGSAAFVHENLASLRFSVRYSDL